MALPLSTVSTNNISSLPNLPNDTGDTPLTPEQLKAKYDKFGEDWNTFYNEQVVPIAATLDDLSGLVAGSIPDGSLSKEKLDFDVATQAELDAVKANLAGTGRTTETIKGVHDELLERLPTGFMAMWPALTPPVGYLKRNGAAISRTTYSALFSVLGTLYGAGDGSTTFNLPDDRALVERGWDDGKGYDTGRVFGSYQADDNKAHTHTGTTNADGAHTHTVGVSSAGSQYSPGGSVAPAIISGSTTTSTSSTHTHTFTTTSTGSAENTVKNRAYLPVIKY